MTIRSRNRFVGIFLVFAILSILAVGWFAVRMLLSGTAASPPENILSQILPDTPAFFSYSFTSVLISISFLAISVPIITDFVMVNFEKTQVQEYVYFILFLGGCLCELTRLFIPVFDLWETNSTFLFSSARLLVFGRTLTAGSFLFPSLFSVSRQNQETGRNVLILIALSGIFALLIPLNTARILPDCTVATGYKSMLSIFTLSLFLLTLVSLLIASQGAGREQKMLAAGYALLFAGYRVLSGIQSISILVLGLILFSIGIYIYLSNLHRLYMWK